MKNKSKMYLLAVSAATLTSTVLTGCAALEKAAAEGGNRFIYLNTESQIRQMRNNNFDELYNTYKKERDDYKKANPNAVIAEDTTLPYMAYLAAAASCAYDREQYRYLKKNYVDVYDDLKTEVEREYKVKEFKKALEEANKFISSIDQDIAKNNEELKKLQFRLEVIAEAKANKKHMVGQKDWEYEEKSVNDTITKVKTANKSLEEAKESLQKRNAKIQEYYNELEKKRKDPAFQYPKKNICSSSVPLWQNIKSGMNIIMLETEEDPIDGRTVSFKIGKESIEGKMIGGYYSLWNNDIGRIKLVYARENMKDAKTGVFVGVRINFKDEKLFDDLVKKYKNEMPKARVKKDTFEAEKQKCSNYFTRYVIFHKVEFREGARVVLIQKVEIKTVFTDAYKKLPPKRKEQILQAFKKEWKVSSFNNPNADCIVIIYDEEQLKAYHQFYLKYKENQKEKTKKANQKKLNF